MEWARQNASQAGFLQKLGTQIPVFKRRFFLLQPGTHLYYFLSPTDTEPRGCLDVEGSWIEHNDKEHPERFTICWEGGRRVVLEARNADMAREWRESLEQERLSYHKAALQRERRKVSAYTSRVQELETQIQNFKLVEQDRDGALEDAARWKEQFEQLDESCRLLTQLLWRKLSNDNETKSPNQSVIQDQDRSEEKKEESLTDGAGEAKQNGSVEPVSSSQGNDKDELDVSHIDVVNVPGDHFSTLYNACEQILENNRLASKEASSAVQDLTAANARLIALEKRMAKAEKHLCTLWEENCDLRKTLKQKKQEKNVLVREIKHLLQQVKTNEERSQSTPQISHDDNNPGIDEERLIDDLENEILSSIRLNGQLIVNGANTVQAKSGVLRPEEDPVETPAVGPKEATTVPSAACGPDETTQLLQQHNTFTPRTSLQGDNVPNRNLLSLFDDSLEEESGGEEDALSKYSTTTSLSSSLFADGSTSSSRFESSSNQSGLNAADKRRLLDHPSQDMKFNNSTKEKISGELIRGHPSMRTESTRNLTSNKGEATSLLTCPLADVVSSSNPAHESLRQKLSSPNGMEVYHLTFYSRKIGIQFQKVPPPPSRGKGLLTEILTDDLSKSSQGAKQTAAELRRIATFSAQAKNGQDTQRNDHVCQPATPVDAVLVCGFNGFDDSGDICKPSLGARLVAFDGISVEVGRWTFESIRKAIQARSRPLTLSFRNDFLTTEQRVILTRALKECSLMPPSSLVPVTREGHRETIPHEIGPQQQPAIVMDDICTPSNHSVDDENSRSGVDSESRYSIMPYSFSASKSVSSVNGGGNAVSFSDVGSSTSVFSAVVPLVNRLLQKRGAAETFTPDYLRRAPTAVEDTPHYHEFRSELL